MKVLHIINGLSGGGAEKNLYNICLHDKKNNEHIVLSLTDTGKYGVLLKKLNIEVYCFDLRSKAYFFKNIYLIHKLIRLKSPEIIQTWLHHANLIGGVIAKFNNHKKIFWNIRQSEFIPEEKKSLAYFIDYINSKLSNWIPKKIICNSYHSKKIHAKYGYNAKKIKVISNGIDTDKFYINLKIKKKNKPKDIFIFGSNGRYDPYKDYNNLLLALSIIKKKDISFKLLMSGLNMDRKNIELNRLIDLYNLKKNICLLGFRTDIPKIMNSLDLFILSSLSESFPNVIAEAMACGVPCVSTNVGDVKKIIGKTGVVVKPGNPQSLAKGILIALKKITSGRSSYNSLQISSKIIKNYNINKMIKEYQFAWNYKNNELKN